MKKSLYELALEYDDAIKDLQKVVENVRRKRAVAKRDKDLFEVYSLSKNLELLYEQIRDMKIISEKLKNYYKENNGKKEEAA